MRVRIVFLGLAASMLVGSVSVEAQIARTGARGRRPLGHPQMKDLVPRGQWGTLQTFGGGWQRGFQTRPQQLRQLSRVRRHREGLLSDPPALVSPIRQALDRRNLLSPRSQLGRRAAAFIGRHDYLADENGGFRGDVSRWPTPQRREGQVTIDYTDDLASRLDRAADDYFEMGIVYFRTSGDPAEDVDVRRRALIKSRNSFEKARTLRRGSPQAYIGGMFVAWERREYSQATTFLLRALDRAETPADLKIDQFMERMYAGEDMEAKRREFSRTVESANMLVNSQTEASFLNLILAYFSWLDGDMGTARRAAMAARAVLKDEHAVLAEKLLRFIVESQDGASMSPAGP